MSVKRDIRSIEQRIQAVATRPRITPQGTVFPRSDYIYTAVPTSLKYMLSADGTVIEVSASLTDIPVLYVYEADAYYKQVSQKAFDDTQDADKPVFTKDSVNGVYKAAVAIRLVSPVSLVLNNEVLSVNRGAYFEAVLVTGWPFGTEYAFGISIYGAAVTVYSGTVEYGETYAVTADAAILITADGQYVALELDRTAGTATITGPHNSRPVLSGDTYKTALYSFDFADGVITGWHDHIHDLRLQAQL